MTWKQHKRALKGCSLELLGSLGCGGFVVTFGSIFASVLNRFPKLGALILAAFLIALALVLVMAIVDSYRAFGKEESDG